jgi:WD40 repeat protein
MAGYPFGLRVLAFQHTKAAPRRTAVNVIASAPGAQALCPITGAGGVVALVRNQDATLWLANAHTGAVMATLPGFDDYVDCLRFSPDGQSVAMGAYGGELRLYRAHDGRAARAVIRAFSCGNTAGLSAPFIPKPRRVMAAPAF